MTLPKIVIEKAGRWGKEFRVSALGARNGYVIMDFVCHTHESALESIHSYFGDCPVVDKTVAG